MSFSTSSVLEVFALDFASPGDSLPLAGSIQAPERFNRMSWGPRVDASHPLGIIAGGLADGSVVLWDPALITEGQKSGKQPLLAKMQKHQGPVKGVDFNLFSPNLLATGATDGELCIWDVAKPSSPSMYPGLRSQRESAGGSIPQSSEITFIAWNRKVQHILASTSSGGTTVVWDLKKQKPVISFKDPNNLGTQRRDSVLQWNPEVATQLIVASDNDRSPTLQMWDLRNSVSPIKEFVGHSKGVLGMAWSTQDPSLLLSSGKDNRTICWDVATADILCELPPGANWSFDVQWCPTTPGVFSTSSFDGHVGLFSLQSSCTLPASVVTETVHADFSVSHHVSQGEALPLKKAPQWMKRPVGATFGFGGKLLTFNNLKTTVADPQSGQPLPRHVAQVSVSHVVTDQDLIVRTEQFEKALAGGEKSAIHSLCRERSAPNGLTPEEAETWAFIGLLFEENGRTPLLRRLGFEDMIAAPTPEPEPTLSRDVNQQSFSPNSQSVGHSSPNAPPPPQVSDEGFFDNPAQEETEEDFFDKLPSEEVVPTSIPPPQPSGAATHKDSSSTRGGSDEGSGVIEGGENENEIQKALIAGNYELAVETCFKSNRLADALLIANVFSGETLKRTMFRYMRKHPRPFMALVQANMEGDFTALVRTRPVSKWRETLAMLATYCSAEEWIRLSDMLASRLDLAGMGHEASLCYICAGNIDQAVAHWTKSGPASTTHTGKGLSALSVVAMQSVVEKAVVFGLGTGSRKTSDSLSNLVALYASILASQGKLTTALEYLDLVPGEASTNIAVLKDRIYRTGVAPLPAGTYAPPFPFVLEDVKPAAVLHPIPSPGSYPLTPLVPATASAPFQGIQGGYAQQGQGQGYSNQQSQAYPQQAYQQSQAYPHQQQQSQAYPQQQQQSQAYPQQQQQSQAYPQQQQQSQAYPQQYSSVSGGAGFQSQHAPDVASSGAVYKVAPKAKPAPVVVNSAPVPAPLSVYAASGASAYSQPAPTPPVMPQAPSASPPAVSAPPPQAYFVPTTTSHSIPQAPPAPAAPAPPPSCAPPPPQSVGGFKANAPPPLPAYQTSGAYSAPPPSGPPPTVLVTNADTSNVPSDQQPIVASLLRLYTSCLPLVNNPVKKREMDDNAKKLGQLLWRMNAREVSPGVLPKLQALCTAIDASDWHTANHIQVQMTTTDWDECGVWLSALKRLIKMKQ